MDNDLVDEYPGGSGILPTFFGFGGIGLLRSIAHCGGGGGGAVCFFFVEDMFAAGRLTRTESQVRESQSVTNEALGEIRRGLGILYSLRSLLLLYCISTHFIRSTDVIYCIIFHETTLARPHFSHLYASAKFGMRLI